MSSRFTLLSNRAFERYTASSTCFLLVPSCVTRKVSPSRERHLGRPFLQALSQPRYQGPLSSSDPGNEVGSLTLSLSRFLLRHARRTTREMLLVIYRGAGWKTRNQIAVFKLTLNARLRYFCYRLLFAYTVQPVYNGPVLRGHPLLSSQFSKSQFFAHTNAVFVTCIKRSPLLSGRGHPVAVLCFVFLCYF